MPSALLLVAAFSVLAAPMKIGDRVPQISTRDVDRQPYSLRDHIGYKPKDPHQAVVLAFLGSWDAASLEALPALRNLHRAWAQGENDIHMVHVFPREHRYDLAQLKDELRLPGRLLPDPTGGIGQRFNIKGLPHIFILSSDGRLAFQHLGMVDRLDEILSEEVRKTIEQGSPLLAQSSAALPKHARNAVADRYDTSYVLGRPPSDPGATIRWQPVAMVIGEEAEAYVRTSSETSYESFHKQLRKGAYEMANLSPVMAYKLRQLYEPVAMLKRNNAEGYYGIVFTLLGSPIQELHQLKGKTLGLVSPESASGGIYPLQEIAKVGLKIGTDVKIKWLHSHAEVAEAVKNGEVDAGGCYDDCRLAAWHKKSRADRKTRLLAVTERIPPEVLAVRRTLPREVREKLKKALRSPHVQDILQQVSNHSDRISEVVAMDVKDLTTVEKAIQRVELATVTKDEQAKP